MFTGERVPEGVDLYNPSLNLRQDWRKSVIPFPNNWKTAQFDNVTTIPQLPLGRCNWKDFFHEFSALKSGHIWDTESSAGHAINRSKEMKWWWLQIQTHVLLICWSKAVDISIRLDDLLIYSLWQQALTRCYGMV